MKVFISADIEGVNNIVNWKETTLGSDDYNYFRKQMTEEVRRACIGAKSAGATEILVKDAHDSARNLVLSDLPEYVKLHRGWQGCPGSMMGGLDKSFDAVVFVGYHSPSRSNGNPLSHTMNTRIHHVKINGVIASEFYINALYATYLGVPIAFLSGDKNLTKLVKAENENIITVATKEGAYGAVVSKHPSITNDEIEYGVKEALSRDLKDNKLIMPRHFDVEIQYKNHTDAYSNSFYPGCKLLGSDRVLYSSDNYYDVLTMLKFIL
jgi:D-amino peptidase